MKLLQYELSGVGAVGRLEDDGMITQLDVPAMMSADEAIISLAAGTLMPVPTSSRKISPSDVTLAPPVRRPPSIRDFLLFEQHLENCLSPRGRTVPEAWFKRPSFYFTSPHTITGSGATVSAPKGLLDYELELAVVIGVPLNNATPEEAVDAIVGVTLFNDFSLRDVQVDEHPLGLGPSKSKDFASALGPVLVTPDEIPGGVRRPDLTLEAWVNGELWSRGATAEMHFDLGMAIAHASENSWVMPGDVIATGTVPTGCILELRALETLPKRDWLRPGDVVELVAEPFGRLATVITA